MVIKALCDYYDYLVETGQMLPEGYSGYKIHFLIHLSPEGTIDKIEDYRVDTEIGKDRNGKPKIKKFARVEVMPEHANANAIFGNVVEQRPLYIFGLNYEKGEFTWDDRTEKAKKSHASYVEKNLEFIKDIDSPVAKAFEKFLHKWNPEDETENIHLLEIGKDYSTAGFAFCLSGDPDNLLHNDKEVRKRWEEWQSNTGEEEVIRQCSILGEMLPVSRIHDKINGVAGASTSGASLVSFNNASENSYGQEQSYNSSISVRAMKKYTRALNFLLADRNHKTVLGDITIVHWSMDATSNNDAFITSLFVGSTETFSKEQTEDVLTALMKRSKDGRINDEKLAINHISPNVNFFLLGLKGNNGRISMNFFEQRKFGVILENIAMHQSDMQVKRDDRMVSVYRITQELLPPASKNAKVSPALIGKLTEAVLLGKAYPESLLDTIVRRVKTDIGIPVNSVRAGIIKACLNRENRIRKNKEEITMYLNPDNTNKAYLCGRLFAVLELAQKNAANVSKLNHTIKDGYFASAISNPDIIFPQLLAAAQYHLSKLEAKNNFRCSRLVEEIVCKMGTGFPKTLPLKERGNFMMGYYHQVDDIYTSNEEKAKLKENAEEK